MKTTNFISKLGFAFVLLLLIGIYSQTHAQSHNVKCISCKYYQKPAGTTTSPTVKIECACEPCQKKNKEEHEAKRAEDNRRQEVIIAENQRKAKEETERRKREEENNKPTEVVISAPKITENKTKTKVDTNSDDLKEWRTFEDKNSRPPKIGFGYYDSEKQTQVITIPAIFDYHVHGNGSSFMEGSKYTAVSTTRPYYVSSPCDDDHSIQDYSIINRKGEAIVPSSNNTGYFVIQPSSFAIEFSYLQRAYGGYYGCSANIFNIETKEVIAELKPNYIHNKYGVTSKVNILQGNIFYSEQKDFFIYVLSKRFHSSEMFSNNLKREFSSGKYVAFLLYPEDTDFSYDTYKSKRWTGYLLGKDGKYKIVTDEWLTNILGKEF